MFELPDAKRVRREDLLDPDSARQSGPGEEEQAKIQARLKAHLSKFLSVDLDALPQEETDDKTQGDKPQPDGEAEEPEFEFRLFSTGPVQKVALDDQKEGGYDENSGGIVKDRPLSHYVQGELSPEKREQFQAAAISGGDVLRGAKQRAWGLELPWRVTTITMPSDHKGEKVKKGDGQIDHKSTTARIPGQEGTVKRKKLGKKARIATRIKQKAAAELEKQRMTKEEHLKEKKKRLNREKKLKRRQKEKEKRLASGLGGGGPDGNAAASGADSMSEGDD